MEHQFTDANFEEEVLKSEMPVLVDFYADWCVPCKMMGPVVKELAEKYEGQVKIGKLNIQENPKITEKYGIMSIPSFLIFKQGEKSETVIGRVAKSELDTVIQRVLA